VYISANGNYGVWFYSTFWMVGPVTNIAEEKFTDGVIRSQESVDCPDQAIEWEEKAFGADWRSNNIDIQCDGKKM